MFCLLKKDYWCVSGWNRIRILLVLLLPITGWLFIIGVALACIGIMWLAC